MSDPGGIVRGMAEGGGEISPAAATRLVTDGRGYVDSLLRHFEAYDTHSIDASDYEDSTFVHDMNTPLPQDLEQRYTFVFDGGSLEHIFNVPQALANCLSAVTLGGHYATVATCNNMVGHGFYQFSPEFFFRALAPANGFEVRLILVRARHDLASWRQVSDPAVVGGRVEMTNAWPTVMYVLARRTTIAPVFASWPQQSDYVTEWATGHRAAGRRSKMMNALPAPVRRAARAALAVAGTASGPGHFQRIHLANLQVG